MKSRRWLLALALVAMPLHAEIVRLSCEGAEAGDALLVEVNYVNKLVIWANAVDMKWLGPVQAKVTDGEIGWDGAGASRGIRYRIDRITGELEVCGKQGCSPPSSCKKSDGVRP